MTETLGRDHSSSGRVMSQRSTEQRNKPAQFLNPDRENNLGKDLAGFQCEHETEAQCMRLSYSRGC